MDWLERERRLIGSEAVEKITASRSLIFGIGGVGGHVVEALTPLTVVTTRKWGLFSCPPSKDSLLSL